MDKQDVESANAVALPNDYVQALAAEIAIPVEPDRLQAALSAHARTHDALMRVRSIPLQYSPTYVEPLTALRWIERGGHSVE
jgi:hypothetical protein